MGRSVTADESTEAYIQDLIKGRQWYIGLIIGQLSSQKDFVLRLARTPEAAEDDVCDESEVGQLEELPSHSKKKKTTQPKSLDKADEQWLAVHATQVTRMLPGGLDVIGIFAVAPSAMLKDSQAKLRQLIYAIHKSVMKNVPVQPPGAVTDRIILQVDSMTSKIVCSSIDVSTIKVGFFLAMLTLDSC
ncbi:hypothetical protein V1264_006064 [Littorina saxatilis]|uniref:Protein odr-4 homolog n=1 Tax=Littorina saxatilis TaxID=31220 RepID=A0AAN9AWD7_9CAEN